MGLRRTITTPTKRRSQLFITFSRQSVPKENLSFLSWGMESSAVISAGLPFVAERNQKERAFCQRAYAFEAFWDRAWGQRPDLLVSPSRFPRTGGDAQREPAVHARSLARSLQAWRAAYACMRACVHPQTNPTHACDNKEKPPKAGFMSGDKSPRAQDRGGFHPVHARCVRACVCRCMLLYRSRSRTVRRSYTTGYSM